MNAVTLALRLASGARLRAWRAAKDWTVAEAAAFFGVGKSAWHAMEQGRALVSIELAIRMGRDSGVTLDWIYLGDPTGMPRDLRRALARVAAEAEKTDRKTP